MDGWKNGRRRWIHMGMAAVLALSLSVPGNIQVLGESTEILGVSGPRISTQTVKNGQWSRNGQTVSGPEVLQTTVAWDILEYGSYWQDDTNGDGKVLKEDITVHKAESEKKDAQGKPVSYWYEDQAGNKLLGADWEEKTYHADEKQPIQWRVLSVDPDGTALLLSEKILDIKNICADGEADRDWGDLRWSNGVLRSWLNGYGADQNLEEVDYTKDNFIKSAFTDREKAGLLTSKVKADENPFTKEKDTADTEDKVFLLSMSEVLNEKYGFQRNEFTRKSEWLTSELLADGEADSGDRMTDIDDTRSAYGTDYCDQLDYYYRKTWFLRTPVEEDETGLCIVREGGRADVQSNEEEAGIRPAVRINLRAPAPYWIKAGTVTRTAKRTQWDGVWFGRYWQGDTNGDGVVFEESLSPQEGDAGGIRTKDEKQPIKWRVLSVDEEGNAYLMSDTSLCPADLFAEDHDAERAVPWKESVLRSYLNGYGAAENNEGRDFTNKGFINQAFTAEEKASLVASDYGEPDSGKAALDRIAVPSVEEAMNPAYGFHATEFLKKNGSDNLVTSFDDSRSARISDYLIEEWAGAGYLDDFRNRSMEWRLRNSDRLSVGYGGKIYEIPNVDFARLSLHLNLNDTKVWKQAGKVFSSGEMNEEEPTEKETEQPTEKPTEQPTEQPTEKPTEQPTEKETEQPTEKPTEKPTEQPTEKPTEKPDEGPAAGEPKIEIKIVDNVFTNFINKITFGWFFDQSQRVTIDYTDKYCKVTEKQYYVSETPLSQAEVKALPADQWTDYTKAFNIPANKKSIVYARIQNERGTEIFVCSDGMVVDTIKPQFEGISDGGEYRKQAKFTILESNLLAVMEGINLLNPDEKGEYVIKGDDLVHTIYVMDKAGNMNSVTITVTKEEKPPVEDPTEKETEKTTEKETEKPTEKETEKPTEEPTDQPIKKILPVLEAEEYGKTYDGTAVKESALLSCVSAWDKSDGRRDPVEGTFSLKEGKQLPKDAGEYQITVTFVPKDRSKYESVEGKIRVTIEKRTVYFFLRVNHVKDHLTVQTGSVRPVVTLMYDGAVEGEKLLTSTLAVIEGLPADTKTPGTYAITWVNADEMIAQWKMLPVYRNYNISVDRDYSLQIIGQSYPVNTNTSGTTTSKTEQTKTGNLEIVLPIGSAKEIYSGEDGEITIGKNTYLYSGKTAKLIETDSKAKTFTVAEAIMVGSKLYKVTALGEDVFRNNKKLKKVIISKNCKTIGKNAFRGAKKLGTVVILSKLKKVGKNACKGIKRNAVFKIRSSKKNYKKMVKMIKKSQVDRVRFQRN